MKGWAFRRSLFHKIHQYLLSPSGSPSNSLHLDFLLSHQFFPKGSFHSIPNALSNFDFLQKLPPRFIQDPIHPDQFSIKDYQTNKTLPAKKEDCIGMERASVWEAHAIEERLNDFYSGKYQFNSLYFDRPELFKKVAVTF